MERAAFQTIIGSTDRSHDSTRVYSSKREDYEVGEIETRENSDVPLTMLVAT